MVYFLSRSHDAAGGPGHGGREEVAGDRHQRGQPEGREERRGVSFTFSGPGEQEGAASHSGL